ncbi:hypothetical protein FRC14_006471 [Serendipita sp. 396]|nr:hypothetical protein FRC14_006471 [Serendipita sp. 396]KAG8780910.1 hypothetical protein FRC15_009182 [Serendipita sp. 397]KAG8796660.1 hypothetical protein FRC16_009596 [Serendipita sp. 398]
MVLGFLLSIVFLGAATHLAAAFVPEAVRNASLEYVRLSSFSALASATEYSVSLATRALDRPDVPLLISSTKFIVNIILDLILISKFHIPSVTPTVKLQAIIRLSCDLVSSFAGLAYFIYRNKRANRHNRENPWPSIPALKILLRPGLFIFTESAVRNALYLWLVHGIISMSADYATAWGVFNTIRWGLIMVPVQALEASTLAFVGHRWAHGEPLILLKALASKLRKETCSVSMRSLILYIKLRNNAIGITSPAFKSITIALIVEVPLCIYFSFGGAKSFAYWLSNSEPVAKITGNMWKVGTGRP